MNRLTSGAALSALLLIVTVGACGDDAANVPPPDGQDAGPPNSNLPCRSDADCIAKLPATTPAGCATATCNLLEQKCSFAAKDADRDGHATARCVSNDSAIVIRPGDDCDDGDATLYPGRNKACTTLEDGSTPPGELCKAGAIKCLPSGEPSACLETVSCENQACVDGSCEGVCKPGKTRCGVGGVETCSDRGKWSDGVACPGQACVDGACGGECTPTATRCEPSYPAPMSDGGAPVVDAGGTGPTDGGGTSSEGGTSNEGGTSSEAGAPKDAGAIVDAGPKMINPNAVQTCNAEGKWSAGIACASATCGPSGPDSASCQGACSAGQTNCSGNGLQQCADGQWGPPTPCANSACIISTPGTASCVGVCTPGTYRCSGQQPEICSPAGTWGANGAPCAASACTPSVARCQGDCVPATTRACGNCNLGSQTCLNNGAFNICSNPGGTCAANSSRTCTTCANIATDANVSGLLTDGSQICSATCSYSGQQCVPANANTKLRIFGNNSNWTKSCGAANGGTWEANQGCSTNGVSCSIFWQGPNPSPYMLLPPGRYKATFAYWIYPRNNCNAACEGAIRAHVQHFNPPGGVGPPGFTDDGDGTEDLPPDCGRGVYQHTQSFNFQVASCAHQYYFYLQQGGGRPWRNLMLQMTYLDVDYLGQ